MLVLCSGEEPWNGVLIATKHEFHDSIRDNFDGVVQHPVLKKWLYLPEASEDFETVASNIVEAIMMNNQRFGVEPKGRKRKNNNMGCHFCCCSCRYSMVF